MKFEHLFTPLIRRHGTGLHCMRSFGVGSNLHSVDGIAGSRLSPESPRGEPCSAGRFEPSRNLCTKPIPAARGLGGWRQQMQAGDLVVALHRSEVDRLVVSPMSVRASGDAARRMDSAGSRE
jgi:hypothetical protein